MLSGMGESIMPGGQEMESVVAPGIVMGGGVRELRDLTPTAAAKSPSRITRAIGARHVGQVEPEARVAHDFAHSFRHS